MTDSSKPVKRKRPELIPVTEEGYNSKVITYLRELKNAPRINIKDAEQIRNRIDWYFDKCTQYDMKPGIESLALALHVNRSTLYRWSAGQWEGRKDIMPDIKDAYQIITATMEDYMMNGKINPVAGIFLMSNNMGYQQKVTHSMEPAAEDPTEGRSIEELRARYADIIDIDMTGSEGDTEEF